MIGTHIFYLSDVTDDSLYNAILELEKQGNMDQDVYKLYDHICSNPKKYNKYSTIQYKKVSFMRRYSPYNVIVVTENMITGKYNTLQKIEYILFFVIILISLLLLIFSFIDYIFISKRKYDLGIEHLF